MNKILRECINTDLTRIIGSYLLPNKQKLDVFDLNNFISLIGNRLDNKYFFRSYHSIITTKITNNNCKITFCPGLDLWTIRPKNYQS